MEPKEIFHVSQCDGSWEVYHLFEMKSMFFASEDDALAYAMKQSRGKRPCEIVLHGEEGFERERIPLQDVNAPAEQG
jgi:hypothetical protein